MISYVTAVYNRELLIVDLYNSLVSQTDLDFEWLVIDDGSTDHTYETINKLVNIAPFSMKVFRHENSGKHKSLNYLTNHSCALTTLYVFIDSDDLMLPHATAYIKSVWNGIDVNNKEKLIGLFCPFVKGHNIDSVSNDFTSNDLNIFMNGKAAKDYLLKSQDLLPIIRKDLFDSKKFPEFDGENFIPESALWDSLLMSAGAIFPHSEVAVVRYQADGLSSKALKLRLKNINGTIFTYEQALHANFSLKFRFFSLINYYRFLLHSRKKIKFYLYFYPVFWIGVIFYFKDRLLHL
ncbi:glycosyltransferase family 2 protein [Aeromonas veronii]|uniref:glycosyltransferase family 2 protein n=1 Tax=Aeromonas veronii TaxID=654 RepID=UPI003004E042